MKRYIITSDIYSFLLKGLFELTDMYWSDYPDSIIVGFNNNVSDLPDRYTLDSVRGKSSNWGIPIYEYFKNITDDYLLLCFEDHYMIRDVDVELLNMAKEIMMADETVDKINLVNNGSGSRYNDNFIRNTPRKPFLQHSSLMPSLWRTSYLNKLLKTAVDFKGDYKRPHTFEAINDNIFSPTAVILSPKKEIYPLFDAVRKGKFAVNHSDKRFDIMRKSNVDKKALDVYLKMNKLWKRK